MDNTPSLIKDKAVSSKTSHFNIVLLTSILGAFIVSYYNLPNVVTLSVPFASIAYFGFWSYRTDSINRDVDSLNHHSEQIYLLGYILTLVAIFGTVCSPKIPDSDSMLKLAAMKLIASLCGISAMLLLKEISHKWESDQSNKQDLFEKSIGKRVSDFDDALNNLSQRIGAISKVVSIDFFEETADIMKRFQDTIKSSSIEVSESVNGISKLCTNQNKKLSVISSKFSEIFEDFRSAHSDHVSQLHGHLEASNNDFLKSITDNNDLIVKDKRLITEQLVSLNNQLSLKLEKTDKTLTSQLENCESISDRFTSVVSNITEATNPLNFKGESPVIEGIRVFELAVKNLASAVNKISALEEETINVTRQKITLQNDYNETIVSASSATDDHKSSLVDLNNFLNTELVSFTRDIEIKQAKLLDTAEHIQKMAERIGNINNEINPTVTDVGNTGSNTPKRFWER